MNISLASSTSSFCNTCTKYLPAGAHPEAFKVTLEPLIIAEKLAQEAPWTSSVDWLNKKKETTENIISRKNLFFIFLVLIFFYLRLLISFSS